MELICKVQNYAWGVNGLKSSVAQLAEAASSDIKISESLPYAELWMGTHPNGPSVIKETATPLSSYIDKYPDCLGPNIIKKFGNQLCFLFKVLSVNQALSIQAHPEKSHAEQLHKERPEIYKDPNHKPEMAIALTPFHALCGFRPSEQILNFLQELPELRKVIKEENVSSFISNPCEKSLKQCFSALMSATKEEVSPALEEMAKRLNLLDSKSGVDLLKDLFFTLHNHYPGDVGCFSIYLLNYIVLQPGEAMFLGPNIIHAYLLGDCMECMACSDNVVRAGLTPKYQDVDTLITMLEYTMLPSESRKFIGMRFDDNTTLFNPPVPDFAVHKIQFGFRKGLSTCDALLTVSTIVQKSLDSGQEVRLVGLDFSAAFDRVNHKALIFKLKQLGSVREQALSLNEEASASILIVIQGTGTALVISPPNIGAVKSPDTLQRGSIIFIQAGQQIRFQSSSGLLAFRALCL